MSSDNNLKDLADFVIRAQGGDTKSMGILIEKTQDRLLRFCIYLTGNQDQAKDLTQETFVNALENIKALKDPQAFTGWLMRAAKNLFLNEVKSAKNQGHINIDEVSDLIVEEADKDDVLYIRKALANLEPKARLVMLLVELEGYSYAEAAKIMGVSENVVRNTLHEARKDFLKMRR